MAIDSLVFTADLNLPTSGGPVLAYECKVEALGECSLFVSGTFFTVVERSFERPEKGYIMMLYDMQKGRWHNYHDHRRSQLFSEDIKDAFICELRWDARP